MRLRSTAVRAALLAALFPSWAFALDGPAASPDADVLYSNQFTFTREGVPLHRIRIREGLGEVRVEGANMVLRAGGAEGPEVRAGDTFVARARSARPARVRAWVAAERRPGTDAAGAAAAAARLRGRAAETRIFEVGSLFSVGGRTVDGRRLVVALGPYDSADAARAAARGAGLAPEVYEELVERPTGVIEAASDAGAPGGRGPEGSPRVIVRARDVVWLSADGDLRLDGAAYPGDIYVTIDRRGHLAAVNVVDEDRLLAGLLPAEMPPSAPMEALKAQAVAARTELLAQIGERHFADPYRLCSDTHCQVYRGVEKVHPRATEAVRTTRGEVLLDGTGRLVDARFGACCGGHGEDNDVVWAAPPDPALRGRADVDAAAGAAGAGATPGRDDASVRSFLDGASGAFCRTGDGRFRWTHLIDARAVGEKMGVGTVRDVVVLARGRSGRATAVRVVGGRGERAVEGELAIRQALGGARSSLFVVDRDGDGLRLRGGGFGHGVGLCQMGAIGRARAGHDYRRILDHYYGGARVVRLYPVAAPARTARAP